MSVAEDIPLSAPRPRGGDARSSLEEVHRTIIVPQGRWWGRLLAFAGPAYLVSVGYMDPGNWATDIAGGSAFGYRLIWVLLMSNVMAVLLQTLSARLGVVTGRDLAQACRDSYGAAVGGTLFALCEVAITACDLAEVLGTAIGIHLLFPHISLLWAVAITGFDVLLLLGMQRWGIRKMEAFIVSLISVIGVCYIIELFLSRPSWSGVLSGFVPRPLSTEGGQDSELYIAIGIIGATVMPHNLYLHSALVQSRKVSTTEKGIAQANRFNLLDSAIALNLAFFVNAAILIVAAATFWARGQRVAGIEDAHQLLHHLLGTRAAPIAFALALICAGQSSTLTGTLAGQITMEGFLHFRMRPWIRRLITRAMAIGPAMLVIWLSGGAGTERLLVLSQVVLSLQLPFAVVPLVRFTSSRRRMGPFASGLGLKAGAWLVTFAIIALNAVLVCNTLAEWHASAGRFGWLVTALAIPTTVALSALLLWLILKPEQGASTVARVTAQEVIDAASEVRRPVARIGVALEATAADSGMLAEAIGLARQHGAELLLMHVVESVGGHWHRDLADDQEFRHDERYLNELADRISRTEGAPAVQTAMGFGDVTSELVRLARERNIDLLVVGGHGHRSLNDLLRGETINSVRHGVSVPVLAVRAVTHKPSA